MRSYRDRALVVRTYDFKEADRIIVLLTREHGVVRGVAKGVRKGKSRFGSRLQILVQLDVQIYPGRNLATITGADTVAWYGKLIDDYDRYTCACALLDVAERLAGPTSTEELFDAAVVTLDALQYCEDPVEALDHFLLTAMSWAGWKPSLFNCASCGARGPHYSFHPGAGGAVCESCRPVGAEDVDTAVLHAMWLVGERGCAPGFRPGIKAAVHHLVVQYLQWHVEQKIPAMKILDSSSVSPIVHNRNRD